MGGHGAAGGRKTRGNNGQSAAQKLKEHAFELNNVLVVKWFDRGQGEKGFQARSMD